MSTFTRAKDGGIEAPMSLGGLFADSSDDEGGDESGFQQEYSEQTVQLCEESLVIRQYCWHMANANKGTFTLAEFMATHHERYTAGDMLELGSATGALSIYIRKKFPQLRLCTSDIDDGGDVQANVLYNFERNGLPGVPHVAHTWGADWAQDARHLAGFRFKFIVASDILLYVSAYPALVKTLRTLFLLGVRQGGGGARRAEAASSQQLSAHIQRLFAPAAAPDAAGEIKSTSSTSRSCSGDTRTGGGGVEHEEHSDSGGGGGGGACVSGGGGGACVSGGGGGACVRHSCCRDVAEGFDGVEFLMSWQRRIAESEQFFRLMRAAGFHAHHHGKCVYSFFLLYPAQDQDQDQDQDVAEAGEGKSATAGAEHDSWLA